eukprot:CAMPEP_0182555846 /NCGR_PEP_ID=MMETSP1324-20130603/301_1 /TAXON_ID=236786 /ORGANISM="Florenciella sp., Strain RCC1587" /LENGTH=71 /DNA_ID=CAMNT_0024767631 /DNA_START=36 /DNA_END=249 /DNA_ORIENTATION=-
MTARVRAVGVAVDAAVAAVGATAAVATVATPHNCVGGAVQLAAPHLRVRARARAGARARARAPGPFGLWPR